VETPPEEHTEEDEMKKSLIVLGVGALIIAVASGVVQAQKDSTSNNMKNVIYVAAANATFKPSPMGGVSMAALWGDMDKGPHATFTKFVPGYDAGMHTHTNDVWIVVIKGAYLYKDEVGEKRVGPGDFLRVPGGHKHWSGGDKTEGALFYEEASGKFDTIPAK
jgi:mannose-6-phosphate isomerase-like protein (cupin superfamily)